MDEEDGAKSSASQPGFSDAGSAIFEHHVHIEFPGNITEHARALERRTTLKLCRSQPELSACHGLAKWQSGVLPVAVLTSIISGWVFPVQTALILNSFFSMFFAGLIALRIAAFFLIRQASESIKISAGVRICDADLPVYSVLVPVFREEAVLPQLINALENIDYPAEKIDIKLIFEEEDTETLKIARSMSLSSQFECLVVPGGSPQTKPRALDFAMANIRGQFITIYDAEDIPQPDQLRCALHAFAEGPENLACVQASLGFYNSEDNGLTRQFALEYAALFHVLLPVLAALKLPMLLGGTSNHFKTRILKEVGGWDPFNVTEDADLGIRLVRLGYICGVIPSETLEEANGKTRNWMRQRSRWLKGWMQTYAVHMRNPYRSLRDMGLAGFIIFQALAGGMIVSALAYPIFLVLLGVVLVQNQLFDGLGSVVGSVLLVLSGFNFIMGYAASALLGAEGALQIKKPHLAKYVFLIPFYWLLISASAYLALWQFYAKPFYWEKTDHGLSPNMPGALAPDEKTRK